MHHAEAKGGHRDAPTSDFSNGPQNPASSQNTQFPAQKNKKRGGIDPGGDRRGQRKAGDAAPAVQKAGPFGVQEDQFLCAPKRVVKLSTTFSADAAGGDHHRHARGLVARKKRRPGFSRRRRRRGPDRKGRQRPGRHQAGLIREPPVLKKSLHDRVPQDDQAGRGRQNHEERQAQGKIRACL